MENISLMIEKQINKALKYSDNSDNLSELLQKIDVSIVDFKIDKHFQDDKEDRIVLNVKIERSNKIINFYFGLSLVETWKYQLLNIISKQNTFESVIGGKIIHNKIRLSFNSTFNSLICKVFNIKAPGLALNSLDNLKSYSVFNDIFQNILYSVLCSVKMDFYCPLDFQDFCSEYGYNSDSIKDKKSWESCLKQKSKLDKIFNENEIDCLPS